MRAKILIAVLALGMMAGAFSTLTPDVASAGPPHVVDGDVGPSMAQGGGNPSNAASASYYLLNKPAEAIQVEANIVDADGTNFAYYGADIGSAWGWAAGDTVVVVVETIRGVNAWAGANYTTSSDGTLTNLNVDSLPQGNIQAQPAVILNKGPTYVEVVWTGLTDENGNVVNYTAYRATSMGGPFVFAGYSTPQVAGGTVRYNETRTQGTWCYKIATNYRRDTAGGFYTTTGTSEPQCTTIGAAPFVQATSPVDAEIGVNQIADIVVTFSEAMVPGSVSLTFSDPGITFVRSNDITQRIFTWTHVLPFTDCTSYTARVGGVDQNDGFGLDPSQGVANPWGFSTTCVSPFITSTTPINGATGVALTADIVVNFSEPINQASLVVTFSDPGIGFTRTWDGSRQQVTLSHTTPFAAGTVYTVQIAANDDDGNALVGGPAANPWSFTGNTPPTVTITAPIAAACWTGSTPHDIGWTMTDEATSPGNLVVWINYSYAGGTQTGSISGGPLTGQTSPATYTWSALAVNANDFTIRITALDGAGTTGTATVVIEIDSTAPSVSTTTPSGGAVNVGFADDIVITFSEGMARTSTETAFSIAPNPGGIAFQWSAGEDILTVSHTDFAPGQQYTVTIGTGARDNCAPGLPLASQHVFAFTVRGVPTPRPPTAVQVTNPTATTLTVSWTAPTTNTDNTPLTAAEIDGYYLFRTTTPTAPVSQWTNLTPTSGPISGTTFTDTGLAPGTTYYYVVRTVHVNGQVSGDSGQGSGTTTGGGGGLDWLLWLLIAVIIGVVAAIGVFAWRRKKKAEEARRSPPASPPEYEQGGGGTG